MDRLKVLEIVVKVIFFIVADGIVIMLLLSYPVLMAVAIVFVAILAALNLRHRIHN